MLAVSCDSVLTLEWNGPVKPHRAASVNAMSFFILTSK